MSARWILVSALLVVLVILPAMLGLAFDRLRETRSRLPVLMTSDNARASATLTYYNDVHDSHSG
jgi:hypothetical protein